MLFNIVYSSPMLSNGYRVQLLEALQARRCDGQPLGRAGFSSTQEQTRPIFEDVPEETVTVFRGASGPQRGVTGLSEDEGRLGRFLTDDP